jgi:hypothetical protein
MSKDKYPPIGTWIAVAAIAETRKDEGTRRSESLRVEVVEYPLQPPGVYGQLVGITYLYSGLYVPGSGSYEDYEQGYIRNRKGTLVYQVRLGMRSKPINVLPSSAILCVKQPLDALPWVSPAIPYVMDNYKRIYEGAV